MGCPCFTRLLFTGFTVLTRCLEMEETQAFCVVMELYCLYFSVWSQKGWDSNEQLSERQEEEEGRAVRATCWHAPAVAVSRLFVLACC
jgi:hypothetical protein